MGETKRARAPTPSAVPDEPAAPASVLTAPLPHLSDLPPKCCNPPMSREPGPSSTTADSLLEELAGELSARQAPALRAGEVVGARFEVVREVGHGGFGAVYLARDRELGREVALKVLARAAAPGSRELLLFEKEARVTAQLNHPNVVTLHDFGSWSGFPYLVLERLVGETLEARLRRGPLPVREALEIAAQVLRALAHAHAAGLIHRDLKPGNVFCVAGGVKVLDFGLAKALEQEPQQSTAPGGGVPEGSATAQGGTPPYMAPEQWRKEPQDQRTDVFNAGAMLFEMLCGEPPFRISQESGRSTVLDDGPSPSVRTRAPRTPPALAALVARALEKDPARRFASAAELLGGIERVRAELDGAVRKRRLLLSGAALAVAGAGAVFLLKRNPCPGAERRFDGVWDAAVRTAVQAAFAGTGAPGATEVFARVDQVVGAYRGAWLAMHSEACEATWVRREQSPELLDLRMACLRRRLEDVRALEAVLARPDRAIVGRSIQAAYALPALSPCANAEALRSTAPLPADPGVQAQIEEAGAGIARAKALRSAGKIREALEAAKAAATVALATGYKPVLADALEERGGLEDDAGDAKAAEATLRDAVRAAQASRNDRAMVKGLIDLAMVVGPGLRRASEGQEIISDARAALERYGPDDELEVQLHLRLARMLEDRDQWQQSGAEVDKALALAGARHKSEPVYARALNQRATVDKFLGHSADALLHYQSAVAILEKALGPDHLDVAPALGNEASILAHMGKQEEAIAIDRRILRIFARAYDPDHPNIAIASFNLGLALSRLGRSDEALQLVQKAHDIFAKKLGPEHPRVGHTEAGLATVLEEAGRPQEALAHNDRALEIYRKAKGSETEIANVLQGRADVLLDLHRPQEALESARQAGAIYAAKHDAVDPRIGVALSSEGAALLALGAPARAVDPLERALLLLDKPEVSPVDTGRARFRLAQALFARDQIRARSLAAQARTALTAAAPEGRATLAEVEAWLTRNGQADSAAR